MTAVEQGCRPWLDMAISLCFMANRSPVKSRRSFRLHHLAKVAAKSKLVAKLTCFSNKPAKVSELHDARQ
jgi:hypothetical protein